MTHTTNMCGSNLKEYAQHILDNKQIAVSTRVARFELCECLGDLFYFNNVTKVS